MSERSVKSLGLDEFRRKLAEVDATLCSEGAWRPHKGFVPEIYDVRDGVLYVLQYENRA